MNHSPGEAGCSSVCCNQPSGFYRACRHLSSPAQHVQKDHACKVRQLEHGKSVSLQPTKTHLRTHAEGVSYTGCSFINIITFKNRKWLNFRTCGWCLATGFLWFNIGLLKLFKSVSQSVYVLTIVNNDKSFFLIFATGFSFSELGSSTVMWTLWKKKKGRPLSWNLKLGQV